MTGRTGFRRQTMRLQPHLAAICFLVSGTLAADGPETTPNTLDDRSPPPSIGLALGSGGATGLAHIAMLQVFDDQDIQPAVIAGSSIGAVIGALYASGLSAADIRDIFDDFAGSNLDMVSELAWGNAGLKLSALLELDLDNGGMLSSEGFAEFLAGKLHATTFEQLKIPLKVVATDFWSGEQIVLDSGELIPAIQASMAVPGLFSPETIGQRLLIDGGTVNPLPYDLLVDDCDLVVAIDVSGSRTERPEGETGPSDVIFNSFEIMQQAITAEKMKHLEPDIYIRPDVSDIRLLHFNRIEDILGQARPAAEKLGLELAQELGAE